MVLPLYVALEKIDYRLIEAARDLYAGPVATRRRDRRRRSAAGCLARRCCIAGLGYASLDAGGLPCRAADPSPSAPGSARLVGALLISEAFVRVIFPLSLPGVFAGSILTFIPAIGDYVNVELLGNPKTQMIGNVIQNRFLAAERLPDRGGAVVHPHGRRSSSRSSSTPGRSGPKS